MKKYKVRFNIKMTYDVEVDAHSKIEAEELAEDMFDSVDTCEYDFERYEIDEPEIVTASTEPVQRWSYDCPWR